jgi:uncharacterized protein YegL
MNLQCPKCISLNPPGAIYCQNCGTTLSATLNQGRTIVAPQPVNMPYQLSSQQVKTIVQSITQRVGNTPTPPSLSTPIAQTEHTVFVIDVSGSMSEQYDESHTKLEAAKRANVTMVLNKAQIDPRDEIGIVAFEDMARVMMRICPIGINKRQILDAIQSLTISGGTDINEGLKTARDLFDWAKTDVVRRIVLLTDGHGGYPIKTAHELREKGVVIDVIGVGDNPSNVDEKLLKKVASTIQGELRYRFIKDQHTLVAHYTMLANKTATF